MSYNETLLGTTRKIPAPGETGWAEAPDEMTQWLRDATKLHEGDLTATKSATKQIRFPWQTVTATGASTTIDFSLGRNVRLILQANTTLTLSNPLDGSPYYLKIRQDGTGGRTVTWPAAVKWPGGTAPVLSTPANALDAVGLMWDSTDAIYNGEHRENYS